MHIQAMLFIPPGFTPQMGLSSITETQGAVGPHLATAAWGWVAMPPIPGQALELPWATSLSLAGQW